MVRCRRAWADATQRRPDSRTAALDGELARSVSPHILRVHAIVLRVRVPGILFRGNDVEIGHSARVMTSFMIFVRAAIDAGDARARLFVKADGLIALSSTPGSFWTLQKDQVSLTALAPTTRRWTVQTGRLRRRCRVAVEYARGAVICYSPPCCNRRLSQFVEQRLGFFQIGGIKPLGERVGPRQQQHHLVDAAI